MRHAVTRIGDKRIVHFHPGRRLCHAAVVWHKDAVEKHWELQARYSTCGCFENAHGYLPKATTKAVFSTKPMDQLVSEFCVVFGRRGTWASSAFDDTELAPYTGEHIANCHRANIVGNLAGFTILCLRVTALHGKIKISKLVYCTSLIADKDNNISKLWTRITVEENGIGLNSVRYACHAKGTTTTFVLLDPLYMKLGQ